MPKAALFGLGKVGMNPLIKGDKIKGENVMLEVNEQETLVSEIQHGKVKKLRSA